MVIINTISNNAKDPWSVYGMNSLITYGYTSNKLNSTAVLLQGYQPDGSVFMEHQSANSWTLYILYQDPTLSSAQNNITYFIPITDFYIDYQLYGSSDTQSIQLKAWNRYRLEAVALQSGTAASTARKLLIYRCDYDGTTGTYGEVDTQVISVTTNVVTQTINGKTYRYYTIHK